MIKAFVTKNYKETQKLGKLLAKELRGGEIIALVGELGSGKTTFTQGLLKGLGVKGPYTSPTFVVIKKYKVSSMMYKARKKRYLIHNTKYMIRNIYHVDAYRVTSKDILALGWEEIINPPAGGKDGIIIIEWADRIKKIIPKRAIWIKFEWAGKNKRKIIFQPK